MIFFKRNVHFTEDDLGKTLAGYHLLPFAVSDYKDRFFYNDEVCIPDTLCITFVY